MIGVFHEWIGVCVFSWVCFGKLTIRIFFSFLFPYYMPVPRNLGELQEEVDALDPRYRLEKIIGHGSYGMVIRARDTTDNCQVAIKRINSEIFAETILALRILREIKLLSHFHDENIVGIRNILSPPTEEFTEFYLVMDMMETDLKQVLRSNQKLTDAHIQFFLYQALRALKVIHSAGVIHRDVTPSNILVNTNCDLKICDFGLAKEETEGAERTDYVTMRWYRAPDLVMEHRHYDAQVDVWGVGCILGELLGSKPLFPGKDRVNQLDKILDITGTPPEEEVLSLGSTAAQRYVMRKSSRNPVDFTERYPQANPLAVDLLEKLLKFHPKNRITVDQALKHPYFTELYDESDTQVQVVPFAFRESDYATIRDVKRAIVEESIKFHRRFPLTKPPKGMGCSVEVMNSYAGRSSNTCLSEEETEDTRIASENNSGTPSNSESSTSPSIVVSPSSGSSKSEAPL